MELSDEQADKVRDTIVEMFGEETVKEIDILWMALHDVRLGSDNNYDFLKKLMEKYPTSKRSKIKNTLLIAAVLYGIRLGEVGYEYHLEQVAATMEEEAGEEDEDSPTMTEEAFQAAKAKSLQESMGDMQYQ